MLLLRACTPSSRLHRSGELNADTRYSGHMEESLPPVYKPFPPFSDWGSVQVSLLDIEQTLQRLEEQKRVTSIGHLENALKTMNREAAVDTNAIEGVYRTDRGLTRTVASQTGNWQHQIDERWGKARSAFDDAVNGLKYVEASSKSGTVVTQVWIRELHQILLASQEAHQVYVPLLGDLRVENRELLKGVYKTDSNRPTRSDGSVHAYAPPEETGPEMARLIQELGSQEFEDAHPVVQAAYAHYCLACVHPFADGNGRVSRALTSFYLYRGLGIPLVVYQDQRREYIRSLEIADSGDPRLFIRFIAERATDTINTILTEISRPQAPAMADLQRALRATRTSPELRGAALRLKETIFSEAQVLLEERGSQLGLDFFAVGKAIGHAEKVPNGYTTCPDTYGLTLTFSSTVPKLVSVFVPVVLGTRSGKDATSDIVAVAKGSYRFDAFGRELEPAVSEGVKNRVKVFTEGLVNLFLGQVAEAFEEQES